MYALYVDSVALKIAQIASDSEQSENIRMEEYKYHDKCGGKHAENSLQVIS